MEAVLIPGQCRSSLPNLNGGSERWAIPFVPNNFNYTPYISECGKPCGRSGYCWNLGEENTRCGPIKSYAWNMCQESATPKAGCGPCGAPSM